MHKKKNKTILMLSVKWPPETFIWQTVNGLDDQGFKIILGVSTENNKKPASLNSGVNFLILPQWGRGVLNRISNFYFLFFRALLHPVSFCGLLRVLVAVKTEKKTVQDKIKRLYHALPFVGLKPGLLHFQWNSIAVEYEYLWDYFKCPVIVSCRGSQINSAPWNPERISFHEGLEKTFKKASAVHCVSEAIKNEALQFGLDPAKARVICPAVDTDFFTPGPKRQAEKLPIKILTVQVPRHFDDRREEKSRFLKPRSLVAENAPRDDVGGAERLLKIISVGNLIWIKGFEFALVAMRKVLDTGINFQYEIIGEGPDKQRLLYTIDDLNLQNNVRLIAKLPREAVRDRLQSADIFLLSSLAEGISNAALEAMACGLSVVSTDCGGMREVIKDGLEGVIVPVNDPGAMASALQRLASEPLLRGKVGAAARQRIMRSFSSAEQINAFSLLYKELITS